MPAECIERFDAASKWTDSGVGQSDKQFRTWLCKEGFARWSLPATGVVAPPYKTNFLPLLKPAIDRGWASHYEDLSIHPMRLSIRIRSSGLNSAITDEELTDEDRIARCHCEKRTGGNVAGGRP